MSAIISERTEGSFPEVVLPPEVACRETLNGAEALHMMGKAAFACAARNARGAVVMAKADSVEFIRPVPEGAAIDIRARVVFQGRSSMTVIVEIAPDARAMQPAAPAITGRFLMIAVDGDGTPIPIPTQRHSTPTHNA